jgi:hypothetical protein
MNTLLCVVCQKGSDTCTTISCPKPSKHQVFTISRNAVYNANFLIRTKETLSTGNLLSVINVLMQLRKVCNHPNLFEPRPIVSPFQMESIVYYTASPVYGLLDYNPFEVIA